MLWKQRSRALLLVEGTQYKILPLQSYLKKTEKQHQMYYGLKGTLEIEGRDGPSDH